MATTATKMYGLSDAYLIQQVTSQSDYAQKQTQPALGYRSAKLLKKGGFAFKDLNKNGKLDVHEDFGN